MESLYLPMLFPRKRQIPQEKCRDQSTNKKQKSSKPEFRLVSICHRDSCETARLILAYADVQFENVTVDDLFKVFDLAEFPSLPLLYWHEKSIFGSETMARMLAKMFGLAGNGIFEQAQVDAIVKHISDLEMSIYKFFLGKFGFQEMDVKKKYTEVFEPACRKYLTILERYATPASQSGFFFDSGVTYADFALANIVDLLLNCTPEVLVPYHNINMLAARVFALPRLQYYLKTRPAFIDVHRGVGTVNNPLVIEKKWEVAKQALVVGYRKKDVFMK